MIHKVWLNLYTNGFAGIPHDTEEEAKEEQTEWKNLYGYELYRTMEIEWGVPDNG